MAFIDDKVGEINCKIVFFGPPLCGKTTTLRYIYNKLADEGNASPLTVSTTDDRTLYFDFVPIKLGKLRKYTVHLHLYTVPGQKAYEQARRIISKGIDGIVFMADSEFSKTEHNIESLKDLKKILESEGISWIETSKVFQYNKRDLKFAVPVGELSALLNKDGDAEFETIATEGKGVMDVLAAISEKVFLNLKNNP